MKRTIYAHRGNLNGPSDNFHENSEKQILECINRGFGVEIDIWVKKGKLYLGHYEEYLKEVDLSFLEKYNEHLLIHSKNRKAIEYFNNSDIISHWFTHDKDNVSFTNSGYLILYSNKIPKIKKKLRADCIVMMPEHFPGLVVPKGYSVCTDYPENYV